MLDLSEEAARAIYYCSNAVLIVSGVLVALATLTSIWSGGMLNRANVRTIAAGKRDVAIAQEAQAKSNAASVHARLAVAEANERAANAEEVTAVARQKVEKLESKLGWRTITVVQSKVFEHAVEKLPKAKIEVQYVPNDIEAANFALELAQTLMKAGYEAPDRLDQITPSFAIPNATTGVEMAVADEGNAAAGYLQDALKKIGIEAKGKLAENKSEAILISVGKKGP